MLARYCGPGLLGLGITALIAGFMSGMAGNVSAFATVWTYDLYRLSSARTPPTPTTSAWGAGARFWACIITIGTAYLVMQFGSIMDYVQALFSFFIAPLFGTVLLGMMWKRATPAGGFWGLLAGSVSSIAMFLLVKFNPQHARLHRAFERRQGHGGEYVPRAVVVADLRRRHRGRQLC